MIVVAIIAIIAAIAIPSLQASGKSAIEAKVIGTGRAIVTAQEQYRTRFGTYALNLWDLGDSGILPQLASGLNFLPEYSVVAYAANTSTWAISVVPDKPGVTGDRSFYVDVTGVLRATTAAIATSTSPPID